MSPDVAPVEGEEMSLENKRILVVEDEFLLARELTKILESAGALVVGPIPSAARAMARLREETVDAAVLDINVRGEDVERLADALKEHAVPMIFATGYEDHHVRRNHPDAPCLPKPVDLEKLVTLLGEALG
ncbi:response regulator [Erythrobacter sp. WG]|uniref:response regulator n=1 Tax=Erythrobacter sp. WG TaxID=2985510 RepID=UPI002271E323|nr:response regulator [Erythrobacter sp. WG]MCX9146550.1 response regulator [Erythrobacter sp. WG]